MLDNPKMAIAEHYHLLVDVTVTNARVINARYKTLNSVFWSSII
jgi:hypothetical protein